MRYVALLRGVNVGGNTMLKMADLRSAMCDAGFENVVTYINSGNIAFDTRKSAGSTLKKKLEKLIEAKFKKNVPVMIREQREIDAVIAHDPFAGEYASHKEMHVLFMNDDLPAEKLKQLSEAATDDERFAVKGREIYCHLKAGVAHSILGKGFFEKKLKVSVTGRNWRTVEKLAEL